MYSNMYNNPYSSYGNNVVQGNQNNPSDKNNGVGMNSDEPSPSVPVRIVRNH